MEENKTTKAKKSTADKILAEAKKNPIMGFLYAVIIALVTLSGVVGYLYLDQSKELKSDKKECMATTEVLKGRIKDLNNLTRTMDSVHKIELVKAMDEYKNDLRERAAKQEKINEKLTDMLINKK